MWQHRILTFLLIGTLQCEAFVLPVKSTQLETATSTKLNAHRQTKIENVVASSMLAVSLAVAASTPLPAQAY